MSDLAYTVIGAIVMMTTGVILVTLVEITFKLMKGLWQLIFKAFNTALKDMAVYVLILGAGIAMGAGLTRLMDHLIAMS